MEAALALKQALTRPEKSVEAIKNRFSTLSSLESQVSKTNRVDLAKEQPNIEQILKDAIGACSDQVFLRNSLAQTFSALFRSGDSRRVNALVSTFVLPALDSPSTAVNHRMCHLSVLQALCESHGIQLSTLSTQILTTVRAQFKQSEARVRCSAILTLRAMCAGCGASIDTVAPDVVKMLARIVASEKDENVKKECGSCLCALTRMSLWTSSNGLDSVLEVCFKAMEDSSPSVRSTFADALGSNLARAITFSSTSHSHSSTSQPGSGGASSTQSQSSSGGSGVTKKGIKLPTALDAASVFSKTKQKDVTLSSALGMLSTAFGKASAGLNLRAAIARACVKMLKSVPRGVLLGGAQMVVASVLEMLGPHIKSFTKEGEVQHAFSSVSHILRHGLTLNRALTEPHRIGALASLLRHVTSAMSANSSVAASALGYSDFLSIVCALRECKALVKILGSAISVTPVEASLWSILSCIVLCQAPAGSAPSSAPATGPGWSSSQDVQIAAAECMAELARAMPDRAASYVSGMAGYLVGGGGGHVEIYGASIALCGLLTSCSEGEEGNTSSDPLAEFSPESHAASSPGLPSTLTTSILRSACDLIRAKFPTDLSSEFSLKSQESGFLVLSGWISLHVGKQKFISVADQTLIDDLWCLFLSDKSKLEMSSNISSKSALLSSIMLSIACFLKYTENANRNSKNIRDSHITPKKIGTYVANALFALCSIPQGYKPPTMATRDSICLLKTRIFSCLLDQYSQMHYKHLLNDNKNLLKLLVRVALAELDGMAGCASLPLDARKEAMEREENIVLAGDVTRTLRLDASLLCLPPLDNKQELISFGQITSFEDRLASVCAKFVAALFAHKEPTRSHFVDHLAKQFKIILGRPPAHALCAQLNVCTALHAALLQMSECGVTLAAEDTRPTVAACKDMVTDMLGHENKSIRECGAECAGLLFTLSSADAITEFIGFCAAQVARKEDDPKSGCALALGQMYRFCSKRQSDFQWRVLTNELPAAIGTLHALARAPVHKVASSALSALATLCEALGPAFGDHVPSTTLVLSSLLCSSEVPPASECLHLAAVLSKFGLESALLGMMGSQTLTREAVSPQSLCSLADFLRARVQQIPSEEATQHFASLCSLLTTGAPSVVTHTLSILDSMHTSKDQIITAPPSVPLLFLLTEIEPDPQTLSTLSSTIHHAIQQKISKNIRGPTSDSNIWNEMKETYKLVMQSTNRRQLPSFEVSTAQSATSPRSSRSGSGFFSRPHGSGGSSSQKEDVDSGVEIAAAPVAQSGDSEGAPDRGFDEDGENENDQDSEFPSPRGGAKKPAPTPASASASGSAISTKKTPCEEVMTYVLGRTDGGNGLITEVGILDGKSCSVPLPDMACRIQTKALFLLSLVRSLLTIPPSRWQDIEFSSTHVSWITSACFSSATGDGPELLQFLGTLGIAAISLRFRESPDDADQFEAQISAAIRQGFNPSMSPRVLCAASLAARHHLSMCATRAVPEPKVAVLLSQLAPTIAGLRYAQRSDAVTASVQISLLTTLAHVFCFVHNHGHGSAENRWSSLLSQSGALSQPWFELLLMFLHAHFESQGFDPSDNQNLFTSAFSKFSQPSQRESIETLFLQNNAESNRRIFWDLLKSFIFSLATSSQKLPEKEGGGEGNAAQSESPSNQNQELCFQILLLLTISKQRKQPKSEQPPSSQSPITILAPLYSPQKDATTKMGVADDNAFSLNSLEPKTGGELVDLWLEFFNGESSLKADSALVLLSVIDTHFGRDTAKKLAVHMAAHSSPSSPLFAPSETSLQLSASLFSLITSDHSWIQNSASTSALLALTRSSHFVILAPLLMSVLSSLSAPVPSFKNGQQELQKPATALIVQLANLCKENLSSCVSQQDIVGVWEAACLQACRSSERNPQLFLPIALSCSAMACPPASQRPSTLDVALAQSILNAVLANPSILSSLLPTLSLWFKDQQLNSLALFHTTFYLSNISRSVLGGLPHEESSGTLVECMCVLVTALGKICTSEQVPNFVSLCVPVLAHTIQAVGPDQTSLSHPLAKSALEMAGLSPPSFKAAIAALPPSTVESLQKAMRSQAAAAAAASQQSATAKAAGGGTSGAPVKKLAISLDKYKK